MKKYLYGSFVFLDITLNFALRLYLPDPSPICADEARRPLNLENGLKLVKGCLIGSLKTTFGLQTVAMFSFAIDIV